MAAGQQDRYALAVRILDLLVPEMAAEGYDLVDVRVFQGGGRQQVRLYVDLPGEGRIDLDGCADASRSASLLLEASDFFTGPWVLEVSSPGVRPPLRREAHFQAAVGSDVQLKWRSPQAPTQRPQNLRGRLVAVGNGELTIMPGAWSSDQKVDPEVSPEGGFEADQVIGSAGPAASSPEPVIVPLAAVLEANLDHDFDVQAVIRQDRRQRKESKQAERDARRQHSAASSRKAGKESKTSRTDRISRALKSGGAGMECANDELEKRRERDEQSAGNERFAENEPDERDGS